ncbi:MAG TPA: hypothetical protein VFJ09_09265 [Nocardioidaceae bacterium]|nr:hypothetical protein [Nocardioidaceae bacterium]
MRGETRTAVVLAAFSFVRSALVGGTVIGFLAVSGAVGRGAVLLYVALMVVVAVGLGTGAYLLARRRG